MCLRTLPHRGIWYGKYRDLDGKRRVFSCGIPTSSPKELAEGSYIEYVENLISSLLEKARPNITVSRLRQLVLDEKAEYELSKGHRKNIRLGLDSFIRFAGDVPLTAVTRETVKTYVASLKAEGALRSAGFNNVAGVRLAFNYALDEGLVERNPFSNLKLKVSREPRTIINLEDFLAGIEQVIPNSYAERSAIRIATILMFTGRRPSEIRTLKVSDIDWTSGEVRLVDTKNGKDYSRIVAPNVLNVLSAQVADKRASTNLKIRESEYLFSCSTGQLASRTLTKWISKLAKKAWPHLSKIDAYTFRHSLATLLAKRGIDIEHIGYALTQESVSATRGYIKREDTNAQISTNEVIANWRLPNNARRDDIGPTPFGDVKEIVGLVRLLEKLNQELIQAVHTCFDDEAERLTDETSP